tara:strand:+ start:313 stop:549 length:237 start_codon:yes stop_codon:yes gene_type:complete
MSKQEENIRIKCGNHCLPEELIDQIIEEMETYTQHKAEKYALYYFKKRTECNHPLAVNEYDIWDERDKMDSKEKENAR